MAQYYLYAHKNSYAMTTQLMLEELGFDQEITWFNVHRPDEFSAEFIDLNPNARVPVLVAPDGPIYESAATVMHLSEHHDDRFMPAANGRQRDLALQGLFYLMSSLQQEVLIQFNAERYFPDDENLQKKLRAASLRELEPIWQVIEDALAAGPRVPRQGIQHLRHAVPDAGVL